jgi:hypothetical protein
MQKTKPHRLYDWLEKSYELILNIVEGREPYKSLFEYPEYNEQDSEIVRLFAEGVGIVENGVERDYRSIAYKGVGIITAINYLANFITQKATDADAFSETAEETNIKVKDYVNRTVVNEALEGIGAEIGSSQTPHEYATLRALNDIEDKIVGGDLSEHLLKRYKELLESNDMYSEDRFLGTIYYGAKARKAKLIKSINKMWPTTVSMDFL